MKKNIRSLLIALLFFVPTALVAQTWPKEITSAQNGGKITIYQPQPESLEGNKLTGRAAVSVRKTSNDEPVFGAIFFEAILATDKDSRTASLESLKITNAKFPGVEDQATIDRLSEIIESDAPNWNLEMSLDQLVATIKQENANTGEEQFNNKAPKIIYRDKPSELIMIDGEPKVQKDKDLDGDRVINTPYLMFKEDNQWNLYQGGLWYKSTSITTGWSLNKNPSEKIKSIDEQVKKQEKEKNNGKENTTTPIETDIIVTTQPAELIQTKGEPDFKNIQGTSLLYVDNTPNDIFKDINSQKTYVLLAGRWYSATSFNGPWEFVSADKLPADFAKIPEGSTKDAVLSSVAGTPAAEEAKIDAQIPQTAKVDRNTAKIDVKYDGAPRFKFIEGTSLELAENSNVTVMKDASGKYYALENGVWFSSSEADGPWAVANERPKEVDKIPPSSPAYNTKYVYVYDQTPTYVYMGYTAGYMGSYIYGPTVVYGTGFYYAPWYGAVYYPHPVTWGFGFGYNPWTGWSIGVGFNVGFMHFGFAFGGYPPYYGGYWGCAGYRPPYRPPYYGGGYYGNRVNHYGNTNININNNITINNNRNNNIYKGRPGVSTRDMHRGQGTGNMGNAGTHPSNRPSAGTQPANRPGGGGFGMAQRPATSDRNNVYADRNGNVYQRDNQGNWNQRNNQNKSWQSYNHASNAGLSNNMNRESMARDRGASRTNNYNNYHLNSGNYNRGGGGMNRGGGGARRR